MCRSSINRYRPQVYPVFVIPPETSSRCPRGVGPGKSQRILLILVLMVQMNACTDHPSKETEDKTDTPSVLSPLEMVQQGKFDVPNMTAREMADAGEIIIFGRLTGGNPNTADVGKGLCPLCHRVTGTVIKDTAPDLTALEKTGVPIGQRGILRIKDPRYQKADFMHHESYPGSGRATTGIEYIVESHVCPSCFVVAGFGKKGTHERESPMVTLRTPPNCQTIEEAIMIDTYLYMKDGIEPPAPAEIRMAYEKFIPESERIAPGC